MSDATNVLAHLSKTDRHGKGKLYLIKTTTNGKTRWGKDYTYHRGSHGPEIHNEGMYLVDYNQKSGFSDRGYAYTIVFLNRAQRTVPSDIDTMWMELTKMTKFAASIRRAMGPVADLEEMIARLSDLDFLTSIRGIGKITAKNLIKKIDRMGMDPIHFRLSKIFSTYAIPVGVDTKRWRWAIEYYRAYPDDLDELKTNPYALISVSDTENNKRARRLAWSLKDDKNMKAVPYTVKDLDPYILDADERWLYHRYRHMAYLGEFVRRVMVNGSTIVMLPALLKEMQNSGMSRYTESLAAPADQALTAELLQTMVQDSKDLATVQFEEQTGVEAVGVTFKKVVRWSTLIAEVADRMTSRHKTIFTDSQIAAMLKVASDTSSVDFTREQLSGIRHAFKARLSAITGPPGTGKTTVAQSLLTALQLYRDEENVPLLYDINRSTLRTGYNTYILAPTGVAAQRIRLGLDLKDPHSGNSLQLNRISHVEIKEQLGLNPKRTAGYQTQEHIERGEVYLGTLHSFLGFVGGGQYYLPPPHPCVIFVDEASMIDEEPMYHLMEYVNQCLEENIEVTLLLSGDVNQLPPVGLGFPFRDLLGQNTGAYIPTTKLTVPKRQRGGSQIVQAAIAINQGHTPPPASKLFSDGLTAAEVDFMWITPHTAQQSQDILFLLNEYKTYLHTQNLTTNGFTDRDIQVLVPLRNPSRVEPGALHVLKLNTDLQQHFATQAGRKVQQIWVDEYENSKRHPIYFAVGDRVIHTGVNGYRGWLHEPIMRGSIGEIASIHKDVISVTYSWMDQDVLYEQPQELDQLSLAYAITGHAAQGSEFEHLLMVIPERGGPTLVDRSWLYTAVTRAKKHLFMVAPEHRIQKAVAQSDGKNRQTYLSRILAHAT